MCPSRNLLSWFDCNVILSHVTPTFLVTPCYPFTMISVSNAENGRHDVKTAAKNIQQQQVTSNRKDDLSMTEWPVINTAAVFGPLGNFKVPTGQSAGNQPPSAGHQSKSSSDAEHVPVSVHTYVCTECIYVHIPLRVSC